MEMTKFLLKSTKCGYNAYRMPLPREASHNNYQNKDRRQYCCLSLRNDGVLVGPRTVLVKEIKVKIFL